MVQFLALNNNALIFLINLHTAEPVIVSHFKVMVSMFILDLIIII